MGGYEGPRDKEEERDAIRVLPPRERRPGELVRIEQRRSSLRWLGPGALVVATVIALAALSSGGGAEESSPSPTEASLDDHAANLVVDIGPDSAGEPHILWANAISGSASSISMNDLDVVASTMVAVGSREGAAAVWLEIGTEWRLVPDVEAPQGVDSELFVVIPDEPGALAMGSVGGGDIGIWEASAPTEWRYLGIQDALSGWSLVDAAAGPAGVVVIVQRPDTGEVKMVTWAQGISGGWNDVSYAGDQDDRVQLNAVVATGERYYVVGSIAGSQRQDPWRPLVMTSTHGVEWDAIGGYSSTLLPAGVSGVLYDITETASGLRAVGTIRGEDGVLPAVWRSADGFDWARVAEDDPVLALPPIEVQLREVVGEDSPEAIFTIDGEEHRLSAGSVIETVGVRFEVTGISPPFVEMEGSTGSVSVVPGWFTTLPRQGAMRALAGLGDHLVVAGSVNDEPAVWSSIDGGATWQLSRLPGYGDDGSGFGVAALETGLAVIGPETAGQTVALNGIWTTPVPAAYTLDTTLVAQMMGVLLAGDTDLVAGLLTPRFPATGEFSFPTLGGIRLDWRDEETGGADEEAIADTAAYLMALGTDIELSSCSTRPRPGDEEEAVTTCQYAARSRLLETLGLDEDRGEVTVRQGPDGIRSVLAREADSTAAWLTLAEWAVSVEPEEFLAVLGTSDDGRWRLAPTLTAESADRHVALAEELASGIIEPESTTVVETSLGSLEFSWAELPGRLYAVSWTGGGFVAFVEDGDGGFAALESPDALVWSAVEVPEGASWIDAVVSTGSSGIAVGEADGEPAIWVKSDGAWSAAQELVVVASGAWPFGPAVVHEGYAYLGAYQLIGDVAKNVSVWRIATDGTIKVLPRPASAGIVDPGTFHLVPSPQGLFFVDGFSTPTLSIWRLNDDGQWDEVVTGASPGGDDVVLLDVVGTRDGFAVVVGELDIPSSNSVGELWLSTDGISWTRAQGPGGGRISVSRLASGGFGVIGTRDTTLGLGVSSIWFSATGTEWEWLGDVLDSPLDATLVQLLPAVVPVAIGDDTAVFEVRPAIGGFSETGILVAHFVDQ